MSEGSNGTTKNLNDSNKQALQALISSLTPNDAPQEKRLSEEQIEALSERLNHVLGNVGDGPEVRRNEKGELLNEEGLPVIDITEPLGDEFHSLQAPEAFLSDQDPPPLSTMSEKDKEQLRIRRDRILDILEEEERRESERELERERKRRLEEVAKLDAESKAAAREMQKKMGKALLRNLAVQREKEEQRKKAQEAASAELPTRNGNSTPKKKKSVSFANVPDVDAEKPKPPVAWGDISVAKLKSGMPKARLKSEIMDSQPMKLEVVERVPGVKQEPAQERDSDDDSVGDTHEPEPVESDENVNLHAFSDDYDIDERTRLNEDSDEDDFDFSQASIQREVALEYIRLRERVGSEARQAMTSHTHEPQNEWDHPKVPPEASLASKPSRSGVSRFKAERHTGIGAASNASASLGTSVLPAGRSSTLQKAVRTGKLENGQLIGEGSDSELDEEERDNVNRMIEALRQGVIPDDAPSLATGTEDRPTRTTERDSTTAAGPETSRSPGPGPSNPTSSRGPSRFKAGKTSQNSPSARAAAAASNIFASSSTLSNTVVERGTSANSSLVASMNTRTSINGKPPTTEFKKSPTVVSVPTVPPASRRPFAVPQVPPDPAVLSNMIIDSPSFPPPNSDASSSLSSRPPPLVSEVRESARRASPSSHPDERRAAATSNTTRRSGKVSRFKAERTQGPM